MHPESRRAVAPLPLPAPDASAPPPTSTPVSRVGEQVLNAVVEIGGLTPLDVGWTFYTLFFLALCMLACVEQPKREGYFNAQAEVRHAGIRKTARALIRRLFA